MSEEPFYRELAKLDKVIMQPYRLAVLEMLEENGGKADFQHLRTYIGLTGGNLGNHLVKLEEAGLIEIEKLFVRKRPRTMVVLTDEGRAALDDFLTQMEQWSTRRKKRGSDTMRLFGRRELL